MLFQSADNMDSTRSLRRPKTQAWDSRRTFNTKGRSIKIDQIDLSKSDCWNLTLATCVWKTFLHRMGTFPPVTCIDSSLERIILTTTLFLCSHVYLTTDFKQNLSLNGLLWTCTFLMTLIMYAAYNSLVTSAWNTNIDHARIPVFQSAVMSQEAYMKLCHMFDSDSENFNWPSSMRHSISPTCSLLTRGLPCLKGHTI